MKELFSVITVCFNEADSIKQTLDSVLSQSYTGYEYIVKDGKSVDSTNEIIEQYRDLFENKGIRFIHISEGDNGTYDAMNKAAAVCSGEYLIFLNGGDVFYSEAVLAQAAEVIYSDISARNTADVYYGDAVMEDNAGRSLFRADLSLLNYRMAFVHQAGIVKKDTFLSFLYDTSYKICADYNFFLTIYDQGASFKPLGEIVCVYNANGISSTAFVEKRKEHERILKTHGRSNRYRYLMNMAEAYIKQVINQLPENVTYRMKTWYKYHVKHYEKWE